MEFYIEGKEKGKSTKNGENYYEEFKDHFWKKPGKYYHFYYCESYIKYEM